MSKRTAEECLKGEKTDLGDPGQSKRIRATVNLRKDVEQQHQNSETCNDGNEQTVGKEEEIQDIVGRDYQTILAEQAMESNKILFLPTGSGKTFIAIMVLKRLFHVLHKSKDLSSGGKRAVFLVNTVALVDQQAEVLKRHLVINEVGRYSGDKNVDTWNTDQWKEEFSKYEVMVMTADILGMLLLNNFISLSNLALIILDECHHAVDDHPMRQVMKLFQDCPKEMQPRVIGLTATLLNRTPKSLQATKEMVKDLEVTLHSTVATVDNWGIVKQFATKPKQTFKTFEDYKDELKYFVSNKAENMRLLCKNFKFISNETNFSNLEGYTTLLSDKKRELPNLISQVSKQLGWLGPYGCSKALIAVSIALRLLQQNLRDRKGHLMINSLNCFLIALSRHLHLLMLSKSDEEGEKALHFSSPKVHALLELLEEHYKKCNPEHKSIRERMQTLVFVEEKMTAKILCSVLANIARSPRFSFLKPGFTVGGSYNPLAETLEGAYKKYNNDAVIQRFRNGHLNVLVCTDILEEGIDISYCNLVVKFDMVKSFRSYVQSKGRARHQSSFFCLMVNTEESETYQKKLHYFNEIEEYLETVLVGHTDDRLSPSDFDLQQLYESDVTPYYTPAGSKVTLTSAIPLLNRYCMSLAHDRFCKVCPSWHMKEDKTGRVIVAIQLPKVSIMQDTVEGHPMKFLKSAKRSAALEVCKKLHQLKELDDFLSPNKKYLPEEDLNELLPLWEKEDKDKANHHKPGTTKRTRLYKMHKPLCFEDSYPKSGKLVFLHNIEIYPAFENHSLADSRKHVILTTLMEKRNFAIISTSNMNVVCQFPVYSKFGAINVRVGNNLKSMYLSEEEISALSRFHYDLFSSVIPIARTYTIFSRNSFLLAATKPDGNNGVDLDWEAMKALNAGGEQVPCDFLKCIVTPLHRGVSTISEAYFVTRVCTELNSLSAFPNPPFISYEDYYNQKHEFKIKDLNSPLLEVQPLKVFSNHLLPRFDAKDLKQSNTVHFPIEACEVRCTDGCIFIKACFLPSVIHRLERFLIADDLRREMAIGCGVGIVDTSNDNNCKLWMETKHLVLETPNENEKVISTVNQSSLMDSQGKTLPSNSTKDISSISKLWCGLNVPIDVERNFESVTDEVVDEYGRFVQSKMSSTSVETPSKGWDEKSWLAPLDNDVVKINLVSDQPISNCGCGPHPCHILEASTAASSNDLWNLERLETLGDSFLKFAVSFLLYERFPDFSEGKLTEIKGQILGNRNLFYCAKAKQLGNFMKVDRVVPAELWLPPCFSIPNEVIDENLISLLFTLHLSKEEQFDGTVRKSTLDDLRKKKSLLLADSAICEAVTSKYNPLLNRQQIADKTVADCVEALIGTYLQMCGPAAAMTFLEWMKVLPSGASSVLHSKVDQESYSGQHIDLLDEWHDLEQLLGYEFGNRCLLSEAMTHASSPSAARSYERLEFVGDAVLDFLITAYIFENCGKLTPGQLTDLRSALVNNVTLACLTVRYRFYKFLNAGSPALIEAIDRFVQFQEQRNHIIDEEVLVLLEEKECKIAESVDVPKALGDLFEALLGAIFIDSGKNFSTVWRCIYRLMANEICNFSQNVPKQIVRRLYETVGADNVSFRVSDVVQEFSIGQVLVVLSVRFGNKEKSYNGFGANKTQAKKSAAKLALRDLRNDEQVDVSC